MGIKDRNVDKVGGLSPRNIRWRMREMAAGTHVLTNEDSGSCFMTTVSGGETRFTLPEITPAIAGIWFRFFSRTTNRNLIVETATADTLVTRGDATSDDAAYRTASQIAGGGFTLVCDGTSWLCMPHHWDSATLAQTIVVTT